MKYREGSEGTSKKSFLKERKNEDFLIVILRVHFIPYFDHFPKPHQVVCRKNLLANTWFSSAWTIRNCNIYTTLTDV